MRISDVLRYKGTEVATVRPDTVVSALVEALAEHNVGAMVVLDGEDVVGIVSERDVVRQLHQRGAQLLDSSVSEIMTSEVVTVGPDETVNDLAATMTQRRIRHAPVVIGGQLAGIVSIGDVVKHRISQLENDREQLEHYISQG